MYGHSQDDDVYKILNKMKTLWQNQLNISVMVLFKTFYWSRYKKYRLSLHSIRYRQLQYTKLLDCFKWNLKFTSLEWRSFKWNRKLNFEKYDREPLTSHMHRFTLSQHGNLVKIHLVALFSQRNVFKYHLGIQYVMEVRYQHHIHLVAEQVTTNIL